MHDGPMPWPGDGTPDDPTDVESRPFPRAEYRDRLQRVQEAMARHSFGALVVVDPANLYYLTGYNAWSFYMPQCLIVPAQGEPHLFTRAMDAQGAHYTAYLPPEQIHGYPEDLVQRPDVHPFGWIADRAIEVGRRQCDVVAQIQYSQALGARKLGGDYPAIVPMLPTGETAGTPHLTWSDLPLRAHEATTIELAGVHHRYHVPLARTVSLGRPSHELDRCAGAVTEGLQAALERMRPGVPARDVHAAFTEVIGRYGYTKASRLGYSIGIGYPPDWGEHTISLRPEETTVLEAGMALHVILGMWMDGWGYELSESVLLDEDGPERLAPLPQELVVKI